MKLTRFQILLGLIVLTALGYGGYQWWTKAPATPVHTLPPKPVLPQPAPAEDPRKKSADLLANTGEAYAALRRDYGEVDAIGVPLRTAKNLWASGQYDQATQSARQAWAAMKDFRKNAGPARLSYVVARGDTLWRIAAEHSPVRQGPGWVAIWKANKAVIKDFDRLEAGTRLAIPPKWEQYVMPYWRPRRPETARRMSAPAAARADEVDLAELPIPSEGDEVLLAELPRPEDDGPGFSAAALKPPSPIYWLHPHYR